MARDVVDTVMHTKFHVDGENFGPAAAFDVLDLDPTKMNDAVAAIKTLNDAIAAPSNDVATKHALREDVKSVEGMVRFPEATPDMPWHADRPAIAVYNAIAGDGRLPDAVRADARTAATAIENLILAHGESRDFGPFGSNYRDAVGPTIHEPVTGRQIDPWAPAISETHNRFFDETDAAAAERVLA